MEKRAEMPHAALESWVEEVARLTTPARIHWCTGSEDESDQLNEDFVASGQFLRLNGDWPNCFLARSDPRDVARVEERTFICSASEDDAGPSNNWFSPMQMHDRLTGILRGSMHGGRCTSSRT